MEHTPVLLSECIEGLNIKPDGIYVDGTLGRGGHAFEIAKRLRNGMLIAIDRDMDAIQETEKALAGLTVCGDRITIVHANFKDIASVLDSHGIGLVDGMLFDFGTSSPQLDNVDRGFSYMNNASLDMRMNRQDELMAFDLINDGSEEELKRIFYDYGEERYSKSISRAIVKRRAAQPIETTFDLNEVIISAIPAAARREPQHPSKRCFQALRIAVNDELNSIAELLEDIPRSLNKGGRVCVISFHSLEDRLVKKSFNKYAAGCVCPKDLPVCICENKPIMKHISKKPIVPDEDEIQRNPRARSAKLRIAEKI
jgi:16S rRNA (cytosine1402-N4)-methyltransferase